MKKLTIALASLMLSAAAYAQNWTLDKMHAKLGFTITHMMVSDVDGFFKDVDATIVSSKPDFSDAKITVTAQTASINTDNDKRDEHLKGPDFFDAAKNPTVTFVSKSLKKNGNNAYKVTGDLTMHGITKTVTLDLSFRGPAVNPMSKKNFAGFKVTGKVKRSDFNIGGGFGSSMLGEEVKINANGEFVQG